MTAQTLEVLMAGGYTMIVTHVFDEEVHQWQDLLPPHNPWVRVRTLGGEMIINTAQIVSIKEVEE